LRKAAGFSLADNGQALKMRRWAWTEEERQAAVESLRLRRVALEAQPQSSSKAAVLRALDEMIADIENAGAE
jgi:hypothetical protein